MGRAVAVDPFGAPEFVVEEVAYRELVGTENLRLGWAARKRGELIIQFTAVIPITNLILEHRSTQEFYRACREGRPLMQ